QLNPERPRQMMLALRAIQTLARQPALRWLERRDVEAERGEPFGAGRSHLEPLLRSRAQKAAFDQGLRQRDAELAGEMVVAAAAKAQLARLRRQRLAADRLVRAKRPQLLQRLGDMRAGEAIIAMPALRLDQDQA